MRRFRSWTLVLGGALVLAAAGCDSSRPVDACAGLDCDDGVDCTQDSCDDETGECVHEPDDSACGPAEICDVEAGCVAAPCEQDADCDDGQWCNGAEACVDGSCEAGTAPDCDDGIACTVDGCDEEADACENTPDDGLCAEGEICDPDQGCQPEAECGSDADCDDGQWCNGAESCVDGVCQAGTAPDCDDGVDCTVDACDEEADSCTHQPDHGACAAGELCDQQTGCQAVDCSEDADCDDGFWCNGAETCVEGTCQAGERVDCDDGIDCTVDSCDEADDACAHLPDDGLCGAGEVCDPEAGGCVAGGCSEDADCDDGQWCNGAESCVEGACQAGTAPECDDGVDCTVDSCDEEADACAHQPDHDRCAAGELCDPEQGCTAAPCDQDADCDDGLWCNGAETCVDGACQAGSAPDCDDGVPCTVDGCDEEADACSHSPDDAVCDDGLWCNGAETCDAGAGCQAGTAPDCDDGVACTVDGCDEEADACSHSPDDAVCDDGLWCNGAETCDAGAGCQAGTAPDCDDGVACTVDSCDEEADACEHAPDDGLCDDGDACNGVETCDAEAGCQSGEPVVCDDGVDCTVDTCDPDTGACSYTPDDGLCDDTNPCTEDVCEVENESAGCVHRTVDNGTSCSDGNVCNGEEVCQDGMCRAGTPLICTDDNPCTHNYCLPGAGCMTEPEPAGTPCPDDDLCNGDEVCAAGGVCQDGEPLDCDDDNPCTDDHCYQLEGCVQVPNAAACDDGDPCTVEDRCQLGSCAGLAYEICGDEIDNDCDGEIDEGCNGQGTFVAPPPFGDDDNPGTAAEPVASIAVGIQRALEIGAPQVVFVAGDNAHVYAENLNLSPGISLYGGYSDDGDWEYDPELYGTIIGPTAAEGIRAVNPGIGRDTVIDGFAIVGADIGANDSVSHAVTVRQASPTFSNNVVLAGEATYSRAVRIEQGAAPLFTANVIQGADGQQSATVVSVSAAGLELLGNDVAGGEAPVCAGLELVDATEVTVEQNRIVGGSAAGGMNAARIAAVGVSSAGAFDALRLEQNAIEGGEAQGNDAAAVAVYLGDCGGAAAELIDNFALIGGPASAGMFGNTSSFGLLVEGDCPAQIEGNSLIAASFDGADRATGILCADGAQCSIVDNGVILGADESRAERRAIGVNCASGACRRIDGNLIVGGEAPELVGLALGSGCDAQVDANRIYAGRCAGFAGIEGSGVGLQLAGSSAVVTNNAVFGGNCEHTHGLRAIHVASAGIEPAQPAVNANLIHGQGRMGPGFAVSTGITWVADGAAMPQGDYRNNIIDAGYGDERLPAAERAADADPRTFDFNDLVGGTLAFYLDEGDQRRISIAEVNAMQDIVTGSNVALYPALVNAIPFGDFHLQPDSQLIDAGTDEGAPATDFEGDARPAGNGVDIGVDEAG